MQTLLLSLEFEIYQNLEYDAIAALQQIQQLIGTSKVVTGILIVCLGRNYGIEHNWNH